MSGIRSIKRGIAKRVAEKNGLKPNLKYRNGESDVIKSGTKIAYEKLFGKEKE